LIVLPTSKSVGIVAFRTVIEQFVRKTTLAFKLVVIPLKIS